MSISDQIKQQVVRELYAKKVSFSWKNSKTGFLFYQGGKGSKYIENMLHIPSRGSVIHCFKLTYNVRYRTAERTAPNR